MYICLLSVCLFVCLLICMFVCLFILNRHPPLISVTQTHHKIVGACIRTELQRPGNPYRDEGKSSSTSFVCLFACLCVCLFVCHFE